MAKSKTVGGMRECSKCKDVLPATFEFFHFGGKRKDGSRRPSSYCRKCGNDSNRQLARVYIRNRVVSEPHKSKECPRCRSSYPLTPAHWYKEASKEGWQVYCKGCTRALGAGKRYGITPERYERLMAATNGLCSICARPERMTYRGKLKELCIDHCHVSGVVRGVLCHDCNWVVGHCELLPDVYGAPKFLEYLANPPAVLIE